MKRAIVFALLLLAAPLYPLKQQFYKVRLSGPTEEVLRTVKKYLPVDPVIVEAGACDGTDSLIIAKYWSQGRLYAFEPVPELFDKLKSRCKKRKNMTCLPLALSDRTGTATFYLATSDKNPGVTVGSSSLLPPAEHLDYDPHILFPTSIKVETVSLDEWARKQNVDHVDFFWLDMQGTELNMLKESGIARNAKAIYTEVEFVEAYRGQYLYPDVKRWMEENGFILVASDFNETRILKGDRGHMWFGNALFVKKELISGLKK